MEKFPTLKRVASSLATLAADSLYFILPHLLETPETMSNHCYQKKNSKGKVREQSMARQKILKKRDSCVRTDKVELPLSIMLKNKATLIVCSLSCGVTVLQMASFPETKYIFENASLELASFSF